VLQKEEGDVNSFEDVEEAAHESSTTTSPPPVQIKPAPGSEIR